MALDAAAALQVRDHAGHRCDYCRLPQSGSRLRFPLDHIVPRQHGGVDAEGNRARCCPACNRHQGPNLASITRDTGELVPLFHPRRDRWEEHFAWNGPMLVGLTPIGEATIRILAINDPDHLERRRALMLEGSYFAD